MFWGLIMEPNKRYTQVVETPFHISQAAMDISTGDNDPCQVMVVVEGKNFLICTLQKPKCIQTLLDLYFKSGTSISFLTNGKCNIHLTGYLQPNKEEDDSDDSDESEEEEPVRLAITDNNKRRPTDNEETPPKKKAKKDSAPTTDASDGSESSGDSSSAESSAEDEKDQLQKILDGEDTDDNEDSSKANTSAEASDSSEEDEDNDDEEDKEDEDIKDKEEEEQDSSDEAETTLDTSKEEKIDTSKLTKSQKKRLKKKQKKAQQAKVNGVDKNKNEKHEEKPQQKAEKKKPEGKKEAPEASGDKKEKKSLSGGVTIEDIKVGEGAVAKPGKTVMVYYEGRLKQNNKMFDNCQKGPGFKFRLGAKEVISGWDVGVVGMKVGGKRKIVCPPAMAYGAKGSPPVIPSNSTLVFEVELKSVK